MNTIQLRERGQITLPKEIRDAYRLDTGSRLLVVPIDADRFEVRVMPARRSIFELMEPLMEDGPAPDIAKIREEWAEELERKMFSDVQSS